VVLQPNPVRRRRSHVPIVETQIERVRHREADEDREEPECRKKGKPREANLFVPPEPQPRQSVLSRAHTCLQSKCWLSQVLDLVSLEYRPAVAAGSEEEIVAPLNPNCNCRRVH